MSIRSFNRVVTVVVVLDEVGVSVASTRSRFSFVAVFTPFSKLMRIFAFFLSGASDIPEDEHVKVER